LPFLSYLWVGSRKTLEVDVENDRVLNPANCKKND